MQSISVKIIDTCAYIIIMHNFLNVWIFESGMASGWKDSPNFVDSTAWEYHSHSSTKPPPAPTNQLPIYNEAVSSTETEAC